MGRWAFFSYARADAAEAAKLHAALDRCRAPADLVGADGANGPVPKTFHPVSGTGQTSPAAGTRK